MKNEDDDRISATSNMSVSKSKDRMKPLSNFSIMKSRDSSQSIRLQNRSSVSSSVRKIQDLGGGRRGQRRLSKIQENISIISTCERDPEVCVLCASGIPSTKCVACGAQGHNRCIEAFFCTIDKKVNFSSWQCPKCVTMSNIKKHDDKMDTAFPMISQVEPIVKSTKLDCPFCKIEMNFRKCHCEDCTEGMEESSKFKKCDCEKTQKQRFTKCLHCRESGAVCSYKSLRADGKDMDEEDDSRSRTKVVWSVLWCILLLTLAFPIAMVSADIYIFIHCFESCFDISYYVSTFFLKGIRLPGTCCRGIWTGNAMC